MELCDGSITGRQQDRKRARGLVCSASPAALHPRLVNDGLALFVRLNAITKRSTLTEYTTRVDPRKLPELMHQWNRAIRACGLKAGHSFDLDFHTIPYHGHEALMEKHYVSRRSRRQNGILAFLARDAEARVFCYANAKVRKNNQNDEIVHFVEDYRTQYGKVPAELVFDSRLTTYAHLAQLDRMGIGFLTLRRRPKNLMRDLFARDDDDWKPIRLSNIGRRYRTPKVIDDRIELRHYPGQIRQLAITELGHDNPVLLLTNQFNTTTAHLVDRYARRMVIENQIAEAVDFLSHGRAFGRRADAH